MSQKTDIEWASAVWNPVQGCSKCSAGCDRCYAEHMSARLAGVAKGRIARGEDPAGFGPYLHVIEDGQWNGDIYLNRRVLNDPFAWRKPSLVFVNSMSDLFHRNVPTDYILEVFEVMNRCPQHTFQILTKRPERAAKLSSMLTWSPNVWFGVSVEDDRVLRRIKRLQQTDAAVKFLSVEPLLGPIPNLPIDGIDWVIVGGESGPGARPMDVQWVRDIRDRCLDAGVAFFFKQHGQLAGNPDPKDPTAKQNGGRSKGGHRLDGQVWQQMPSITPDLGQLSATDTKEMNGSEPKDGD